MLPRRAWSRYKHIKVSILFQDQTPSGATVQVIFEGMFLPKLMCLATTGVVQIMRNLLGKCTHAIEIHVFKVEGVDVAGEIAVSFSRIS